jgi:hypothetical protein
MRIINKYLIKTWLYPLIGAVVFYGALIVTNEAMALSKEVFIQGASIIWLALLLLSSLPELLSIILPIATLLAGLIGTQSLSINSEVVAAQGMGVGYRSWIKSWSIFAALVLSVGLLNSHFITPWSNSQQQTFRDSMSETLKSRVIKPGGQPWSPPNNPNMTIWSDFLGNTHIAEVRLNEVQHMIGQDINYIFSNNYDGSSNASIQLKNLNGALYQPVNDSIILVDTLGELRFVWGLADIAFVGGSMDGKRGGQNMIEPAAYGSAVFFGDKIWNFKQVAQQLIQAGGASMISSPTILESTARTLLANESLRMQMGRNAKDFVISQQGATAKTILMLEDFLCRDSRNLAA